MIRCFLRLAGAIILIIGVYGGVARAQDPKSPPDGPRVTAMVPLKLDLVISRYQGDKRISSVPYTLSVNATEPGGRFDEPARLRMGIQVPIPVVPQPAQDGKPAPSALQYRDVGTNIDCLAKIVDGGRFKLTLTVEESSVYGEDDKSSQLARTTSPVFRQLRMSSVLVLKDGQSEQFSSATDRLSGEMVRIEATLSVRK